jgi:HEAT repeat protein
VISALGSIGTKPKTVIPAIVDALNDREWAVRTSAVESLEKLCNQADEAKQELVKSLQGKHKDVRRDAAMALLRSDSSHKEAFDTMVRLLRDEDARTRALTVLDLGSLGKKGTITAVAVAGCLEDPNDQVREYAAQTLGRIGSKDKIVIQVLDNALKDKNEDVRLQAAQSLGEIKDNCTIAVPGLLDMVRKDCKNCKVAAIQSLGQLGRIGKEGATVLAECLNDPDEDVRGYAVQSLGQLGPSARPALPALIGITKSDGTVKIRCSAIGAIASIGIADENIKRLVADLAKADNPDIRAAAEKALAIREKKKNASK